ncbi:hypothetical protein ACP4OV_026989 [Aristida adscensionis]
MAGEPGRPRARTSSTCAAETARGTHSFKIAGYSVYRALGPGRPVRSASFAVAAFLELVRVPAGAKVSVLFDFRLLNQATGLSSSVFSSLFRPTVFGSANSSRGTPMFEKNSELEGAPYLRDDTLVIECDVTVIKEWRLEAVPDDMGSLAPPSDLVVNLGNLLESEEEADVTFRVEGETLRAHKIALPGVQGRALRTVKRKEW